MERIRTETITAPDGGEFAAHVHLPAGGHGPGVLVIQEIFGVNEYVRDVARRLADIGYVALAPDVFWRTEPGFSLDSSDEGNIEAGVGVAMTWDPDVGLGDLGAALQHLHDMEEVAGHPVAVLGFCFGGTQAFRMAKELSPACAVGYYGSGIADMLDDLHTIECPTMLHFGDEDLYIPTHQIDAITRAAADNHHLVVHVHKGAGHAFDNAMAPHFSMPEAAEKAWTETASFLFMHIGGPGIGA